MADETWVEKLITAIMASMVSNRGQDITFNLEGVELKAPMFSKPVRLSGKLIVQFSGKKTAKK